MNREDDVEWQTPRVPESDFTLDDFKELKFDTRKTDKAWLAVQVAINQNINALHENARSALEEAARTGYAQAYNDIRSYTFAMVGIDPQAVSSDQEPHLQVSLEESLRFRVRLRDLLTDAVIPDEYAKGYAKLLREMADLWDPPAAS